MLWNWFGIVSYSSMKLLNKKVWQSECQMRACHSQQWVALEVPCKPIQKVCSHPGVRLATGEQRAAQLRGIYYPPFGLGLVCAVAGCLFFHHPLLDPHKAQRQDPDSWCSAATALKPSLQPSLSAWKRVPGAGHWQKSSEGAWGCGAEGGALQEVKGIPGLSFTALAVKAMHAAAELGTQPVPQVGGLRVALNFIPPCGL